MTRARGFPRIEAAYFPAMLKPLFSAALLALLCLAGLNISARADGWPAKVFAPYMYIGSGDNFKLTDGHGLAKGKAASERRNTVLAALQKKNPGLLISYTLPIDPDGFLPSSQDLLADAVKKGVKIHSVDLMVMWFGKRFINKGKSEG